ncbi:MAG: FHA domain-containing protein [Anaerolineae bacterium]|nr:FHA domain-containing protein [Anaerolineae bacterium]
MHKRRLYLGIVAALVIIGLITPMIASAQVAVEAVILFHEAIDFKEPDKPGLTLRLYFTPIDSNRRPVLDVPLRSAQIIMLDPNDGGPYPAEVQQAKGPIEVVLVLDVSGTMGPNFNAMKAAANGFIDSMPQETRFTVLTFSHELVERIRSQKDKDLVKNAISGIPAPKRGDGTCLFDATVRAIETINQIGTPGRRAVVIFSDGAEWAQGGPRDAQGKRIPCSKANLNDVTALATNKRFRVPLYTIGFLPRGANVNEHDLPSLETMARLTGGILAVGPDMPVLFRQVNEAIAAVRVAEAIVKPQRGERIASLRLVLQNGATLLSNNETFVSPNDYSFKTPTPTFTPTATATSSFSLSAAAFDPVNRVFRFELLGLITPEAIAEYRVELTTSGGTKINEIIRSAPLDSPIFEVPLPLDAPPGRYNILVTALGRDGSVIVRQTTTAEFNPTATPTPSVTPTPPPVGAQIKSIRYNDELIKDSVTLTLELFSPERIDNLRISIIDRGNFERLAVNAPPAPEIFISLESLAAGEYTFNLQAFDSNGQQLGPIARFPFVHDRQPTPTITPSLTPTPVIPAAVIQTIRPDMDNRRFIVEIAVRNEQLIKRYRLEVVDASTGLKVGNDLFFTVPPHDRVIVPFSVLPGGGTVAGEFQFVLRGLNDEDRAITEPSTFQFKVVPPPPTPTVTPTPEPTPTPSPTPEPTDLIYVIGRAINNPNQRPLVLGTFGVLVISLLFLMFALLRRPSKPKTGTGFLAELTDTVNVRELEGAKAPKGKKPTAPSALPATKPSPSAATAPSSRPLDATSPVPALAASDLTSPVPYLAIPEASLIVEASRHVPVQGQVVKITRTPFSLGRKQRDLNFDNDDNVSRDHAEITYNNGVFYITDRTSTHGTFVDERRIAPNVPTPLRDGARIRLGTTTILRFSMADPEMTSSELPSIYR